MDPSPLKPLGLRALLLPLLVAALLRGGVIAFFTPVVEGDGTEYCRLAENLAQSGRYVGMLPGNELMFPPLHPLAAAGLSRLFKLSIPLAARLVSLISGLGLLVFLSLLAGRISGPGAARLTAWLSALLPGLVLSATATYCESLQLMLLAAALLVAAQVSTSRSSLGAALSGFLFALAYLARVEGLAVGFLAAILLALGPGRVPGPSRRRWLPPLLLLGVMFLGLSPYPLYLERQTGQLRLEGKSERVAATVERFARGVPYWEANYAIDADGEDVGAWLSPNARWNGPDPETLLFRSRAEVGRYMLKNLRKAAWWLVSGHTMTSLLFLLLFPIAWRFRFKDRQQIFVDLCLLGLIVYSITMMAFYKPVLRYLLATALGSALWGGRALDRLLARRVPNPRRRKRLAIGGVILLSISAARPLVSGSFQEYDESRASQEAVVHLGKRIGALAAPGPLMGHETRLAYYAGRTWLPLPLAPSARALFARMDRLGVSLLTVRMSQKDPRPGPWFDPKAPPKGLKLIDHEGIHLVFQRVH